MAKDKTDKPKVLIPEVIENPAPKEESTELSVDISKLSEKQKRFYALIQSGINPLQAYKDAGYSIKSAESNAYHLKSYVEKKLLKKSHVNAAIRAKMNIIKMKPIELNKIHWDKDSNPVEYTELKYPAFSDVNNAADSILDRALPMKTVVESTSVSIKAVISLDEIK